MDAFGGDTHTDTADRRRKKAVLLVNNVVSFRGDALLSWNNAPLSSNLLALSLNNTALFWNKMTLFHHFAALTKAGTAAFPATYATLTEKQATGASS